MARPTFRSIVCGVDGSPAAAVAVRQAAILAGPGSTLQLLSVIETAIGQTARILVTRERAERALRDAAEIVREAGAHPVEALAEAGLGENDLLLERCEDRDLLVIGSHGGSRAEGILAGSTCTAAVHRAPCPVLVARAGGELPGRILVADDGTGAGREAARIAGSLGAQFGCEVVLAAPEEMESGARRDFSEDAVAIREAMDAEPTIVDVGGDADEGLPRLARELDVALLVVGSRRLTGVRALASVSERVAHAADRSVLVVRT